MDYELSVDGRDTECHVREGVLRDDWWYKASSDGSNQSLVSQELNENGNAGE